MQICDTAGLRKICSQKWAGRSLICSADLAAILYLLSSTEAVHMSQSIHLQIRSMKLSEFQEKHEGDLSGPALEDIKSRQQAFTAQLMVPPTTSMQPSAVLSP